MKKKNRIINIIIIILLLLSLILIFKNYIREYFTGDINNKIITAYKNNEDNLKIPWWKKMFTENSSNIELKDSMLGILYINDLNIKEPIFQGATEINLINGVATVDENQTLEYQNVVIAGHSVQGVNIRFYNLKHITIGTSVQIITKDKLLNYEVVNIYNVKENQTEILEQHLDEPKKLTMFTCDGYNSVTGEWQERFVVECKFLGEESE